MSEPSGLKKLNRTPSQIDGDESKHLPSVRDQQNGFLNQPNVNESQTGVFWAPLPNEGSYDKKRVLAQMDAAKKAWKARQ